MVCCVAAVAVMGFLAGTVQAVRRLLGLGGDVPDDGFAPPVRRPTPEAAR